MRGIYFFCAPYVRPDKAAYQHLAVCLAEGLRALAVPVYGNINYWRRADDFLIPHDTAIGPSECDIIVVTDSYIEAGLPMPKEISNPQRGFRTAYLDSQDGSRLFSFGEAFRAFDVVFRTHFGTDASNPKNFMPWAFGLSERMIEMTRTRELCARDRKMLVNFRHTARPHSVRRYVARRVLPILADVFPCDFGINSSNEDLEVADRKAWEQTGRRHNPHYYERLRSSEACATFAGYFVTRWPAHTATTTSRLLKRLLGNVLVPTHRIVQWDSWRFWESLAAGCVTLHADLGRYLCALPVMPLNWSHYVGLDLSQPSLTVERLKHDPAEMAAIAAAGRDWALENYAPIPTARRFLQAMNL